MACAFCGVHPRWWVGAEIELLTCEKCYQERGIKDLAKDTLEDLVKKLEAEREAAEEAKLITKREYPAVARIREKFQKEAVGLSQEYLTLLLEAIAADCDDEAKKLAGAAFSRTDSSLLLQWENVYDSTDSSQKKPILYGSDYDHVKKWRHIEMEVRGVRSDDKDGGPHSEFISIEVAIRSRCTTTL